MMSCIVVPHILRVARRIRPEFHEANDTRQGRIQMQRSLLSGQRLPGLLASCATQSVCVRMPCTQSLPQHNDWLPVWAELRLTPLTSPVPLVDLSVKYVGSSAKPRRHHKAAVPAAVVDVVGGPV